MSEQYSIYKVKYEVCLDLDHYIGDPVAVWPTLFGAKGSLQIKARSMDEAMRMANTMMQYALVPQPKDCEWRLTGVKKVEDLTF